MLPDFSASRPRFRAADRQPLGDARGSPELRPQVLAPHLTPGPGAAFTPRVPLGSRPDLLVLSGCSACPTANPDPSPAPGKSCGRGRLTSHGGGCPAAASPGSRGPAVLWSHNPESQAHDGRSSFAAPMPGWGARRLCRSRSVPRGLWGSGSCPQVPPTPEDPAVCSELLAPGDALGRARGLCAERAAASLIQGPWAGPSLATRNSSREASRVTGAAPSPLGCPCKHLV